MNEMKSATQMRSVSSLPLGATLATAGKSWPLAVVGAPSQTSNMNNKQTFGSLGRSSDPFLSEQISYLKPSVPFAAALLQVYLVVSFLCIDCVST